MTNRFENVYGSARFCEFVTIETASSYGTIKDVLNLCRVYPDAIYQNPGTKNWILVYKTKDPFPVTSYKVIIKECIDRYIENRDGVFKRQHPVPLNLAYATLAFVNGGEAESGEIFKKSKFHEDNQETHAIFAQNKSNI